MRCNSGKKLSLLRKGEFIIVSKGTEHCPKAEQEVQVLLFEPAGTLNTGDIRNTRSVSRLRKKFNCHGAKS